MALSKKHLYTQLVHLSEEFLGPAGERFIRRQVETHLAISPEDIQPKDIPQLVDWIRLMFAMITNDQKIVDDFTRRLNKLAEISNTKATSNARH